MTTLVEESPNSWVFDHPSPEGAEARLDEAVRLLDAGKFDHADEELRLLLVVCPDHMDALHHLALLFGSRGKYLESYLCTREAVRIGLDAIPPGFSWLTGRMLWSHLENRPFMRAYHALGLHLLRDRGAAAAIDIFARLVSVDPNDNLGARYTWMQCLLDLRDWQSALDLSRRYPDDVSPDMMYSKVVALVGSGQMDEAGVSLEAAIQCRPNVASELLKAKHSRPRSVHPGYVAVGGDEEAFDYWERNRLHWGKSTAAYKLLQTLRKK